MALSTPDKIGIGRPQDSDGVDSWMLVKALILCGKNGVFHPHRDIGDRNQFTPLFPKLSDQISVSCVNAQRNLRLVIRQGVE